MFHVKRRLLAVLLTLGLVAALATACGAASDARGWAPPVQQGDLLLVSTGQGRLDGLDARSGRLLWRFPRDWSIPDGKGRLRGIYGAPVVSPDGRVVYLGDYNGSIYAFRPGDFRPNAENRPSAAYLEFDRPIVGGLAFDAASDTLVVAAGERVFAVRASDLVNRITDRAASVGVRTLLVADKEIWGTPVLAQGKVVVSSLDGNLYAVDLASGARLWRFSTSRALVSTPAVTDNRVLVGGFDSRLHAVDIASGSEAWQLGATNWVWSRPAVQGSRAYFGDFNGILHAVDLNSGALLWSMDTQGGAIRSGPALVDGILVVGTERGWLLGIEIATRSVVWQRRLDTAINADLTVQDDRVLMAPSRCVTLAGTAERVYYMGVNPLNGELIPAQGVC